MSILLLSFFIVSNSQVLSKAALSDSKIHVAIVGLQPFHFFRSLKNADHHFRIQTVLQMCPNIRIKINTVRKIPPSNHSVICPCLLRPLSVWQKFASFRKDMNSFVWSEEPSTVIVWVWCRTGYIFISLAHVRDNPDNFRHLVGTDFHFRYIKKESQSHCWWAITWKRLGRRSNSSCGLT